MFGSLGKESNDLQKLVRQQHVDIATIVRSQGKTEEGKAVYQVEASVTLFSPATGEKTGAQVLKKVTVSAVDESIEIAQDKALAKAQNLLGL